MVFAIHQHELAIGIVSLSPETPFHLPPHLGFPASYIKLPLAICFTYGNVYGSMLFSQVIPPSPLTESKSLLFRSVSPSLP